MLKDTRGQGRKFQPKYSGFYIVHSIVSDHIVKLRDPSSGKVIKNPVHLDRLKVAYVRAPQPQDYFIPEVQLPQDMNGNTSDSDSNQSQAQSNHTDHESTVPLRRSTRIRKRPVRFQTTSIHTDYSSEITQLQCLQ